MRESVREVLASRSEPVRICEIGVGEGEILFELAGHALVRRACGSDVNAYAVDRACERVRRLPVELREKIDIRHGSYADVFDERFDIVYFNPPYLPQDVSDRYLSRAQREALVGGKTGIEVAVDFLARVQHAIVPDSDVLLLMSSLADYARLEHEIVLRGLRIRAMRTVRLGFEELYCYHLVPAAPLAYAIRQGVSLTPFARGRRSVIFQFGGSDRVVKASRTSGLLNARKEYGILAELSGLLPVPKVYEVDDDFFVMERVRGVPASSLDEEGRRAIIAELVRCAIVLDTLRIKKYEFTRPYGNVLVDGGRVVLVDFERASRAKTGNVSQLLEYLRRRGHLSMEQMRMLSDAYRLRLRAFHARGDEERDRFVAREHKRILAALRTSGFYRQVWDLIARIPPGKVVTYREIAHKLDSHGYRAVGRACNASPGMPSVPCHRVVNVRGELHGFVGGIEKKRSLLEEEGVRLVRVEKRDGYDYRVVDLADYLVKL